MPCSHAHAARAVTARCSSNPAFVVCPDQTAMEVISAHQVWLDATPSADITAIRARDTSDMRAGHSEGLWAAQLPSSSAAWAAQAVHSNRASSLGRCSRSSLQPSAKSLTARSFRLHSESSAVQLRCSGHRLHWQDRHEGSQHTLNLAQCHPFC